MAEDLGSAVLRLAVELDTATLGSATQAITRSTEQAGRAAGVALGGGLRAGLQQSAVESRRLAQELSRTFRDAGTQSGRAFGGGFRSALLRSVNEAQEAAAARQVQPVEGTGRVLGGGIVSAITRQREEYEASARAAERLLQIDLRRAQILRSSTQGGFGAASETGFRGTGATDPIQKSIDRNRRKRAASEARRLRQEEALDADLQRVRERRIKEEDDDRKRRKTRAKQQENILSNAIIGGAFPLLFGQGIGASLGGAAGGGVGGAIGGQFGFGLSLIGTALGSQFDIALQKSQTLAQGLDNPIKNFDALRQAALLSSRALEKQVEALIASGRATEAEILLRQDLSNTFGDATAASEYASNVDRLNRALSQGTTILANFVAGPLAKLLEGVTQPLQGIQLATRIQQRFSALSPAQQKQIREFERQQNQQLPAVPTNDQIIQAYLNVLREIDKVTGQAAKSEKELLAVRKASARAQQTEGRLSVQRALGLEGLAVSTELQNIQARQNQIIPGFTGLGRRQQEAAASKLDPERLKQLNDLRKEEITTLIQLLRLDKERAQRNADLARSIANVNQLLGVQPGVARDTLRFTQETTTALIQAARAQDQNLQAIKFARGQLGEPTAANASDRKRLLSEERQTRLEYIDAASRIRLSLFEAAERLRDTFREAAVRFTEIRSSAQGLNRFLPANVQQARERQNFELLLPLFRQAQARFRELTDVFGFTPVRAPEFTGSTAKVNQSIRDFIQTVNAEFQARRDVTGAQQAQIAVTENLANVNSQLVAATQALASKNWTVEVQVNNQAGGATTVNAINALAQ